MGQKSQKSRVLEACLCSNLTSKATLDILTATFVCPGTCTALHASPARFRWHHSVPNTHPARWSHPYKIQKQQQYPNFGIISESIPEVRGRLSDRVDIGPLPRDCSALLADPSAAQQAFQQVTCIHSKWPAMADAVSLIDQIVHNVFSNPSPQYRQKISRLYRLKSRLVSGLDSTQGMTNWLQDGAFPPGQPCSFSHHLPEDDNRWLQQSLTITQSS